MIASLKQAIEAAGKLKRGEWVRVHWHDASYAVHMDWTQPEVYSTPTITEGRFLAVETEPRTGMPHIILATEWVGGEPARTDHIPLPCVVKIETREKRVLKVAKSGWDSIPLAIKIVERVKKVSA